MTEAARAAARGVGQDAPETADGVAHGQPVVDRLVALLDLERIEEDIFRGVSPAQSPVRVFGGQVAGQALVAAGRTVPSDREVHSLHAYFIRPGDPAVPIVYEVDRIRDGRSFTTRRAVAVQHGKAIFALSASFQLEAEGLEHSDPMPEVPAPDELTPYAGWVAAAGEHIPPLARFPRPFDLRYVNEPPWAVADGVPRAARNQVWMRADGRLPDDPLVHVCALAYASDITLLDSVFARHGISPWRHKAMVASLDHAMWFHRRFRADEWVLYDCASPSASGTRGLATGRFFSGDGALVASVVQEGLIRARE